MERNLRNEQNKLLGLIAGSNLFTEKARTAAMDQLRDNIAVEQIFDDAEADVARMVATRHAR
jgi:hypothetical protein